MIRTLLTISFAALMAAGCYTEGRVGYSYGYVATSPDLVYVSPGVYVVAGHDEPVFYADNGYWRYHGGVWYRSRTYRGGWVTTTHVPVAVRRIDRPATYVHYRGRARFAHVRDHRRVERPARVEHRRPIARDHRGHRPSPAARPAGRARDRR